MKLNTTIATATLGLAVLDCAARIEKLTITIDSVFPKVAKIAMFSGQNQP